MNNKILDKKTSRVCQLVGSPNSWALDFWKQGAANNWMPTEVNMSNDIKQWRENGAISDDEKLLVKRTLGLFSAGESMVANSVAEVEWKYVSDGACRQYLMRKQYEESLHNMTVSVCCEAFNLKPKEVAEAYRNIPTIRAKERFLSESLDSFGDNFDIETLEGKRKFVKNLVVYYMLCEGVWFFSNFALVMALGRQNKLTGLYDQIIYTVRDETVHFSFGAKLIETIRKDYPEIWSRGFEQDILTTFMRGVELECAYSKDILPNGILGVTAESLEQYVKYIANQRLKMLGITPAYPQNQQNPFPWISESQEAKGMTAFFERREKNYQTSGAIDEDF